MRFVAWILSTWTAAAMVLSSVVPAGGEEVAAKTKAGDAELRFYEEHVRPIFVRRCYECHSGEADELQGELALDRRSGWERGGGRGPAIVEGKPEESLLVEAIGYLEADLQMPPDSKLPRAEIDTLVKWIAAGAPAPQDDHDATAATPAEFDLEARRAAHWAWQPVKHFGLPEVHDDQWPRDAVDRFVLHRLEQEGIAPAEEVDRNSWLRRVTFDLTGLPPTREERAAFLSDDSQDAYEKVVDRLLASPAFGECWGQHWLDVVRFAETKGHEGDYPIPHAWRYRDYAIAAFNANVPFDQFVREHVAGDLLWPPRVDEQTRANQSIQGTAFWHLGEATHSPVDIRGDEADRLDNQIDVFGKAFVGMTIACARCHDHKFDAISTADYYALCGFLESSSYRVANVADPVRRAELAQELSELHEEAAEKLFAIYAQQTSERLKKLSVESLQAELAVALSQRGHPLHEVAALARELKDDPNFDCRAAIERMRTESETETDHAGQVMVDFSREDASWITSGHAFGSGPIAVGDVLLRADPRQPIAGIATQPAARAGRLSGKFTGFYRTPTVTIPSGKLWYRYRGQATVFAAVDSHRTVEGPLHGVVKQQLDSPDREAWFCHDLGDYVGHRAHVEFTPSGEFELYEVVFSEVHPAKPQATDGILLDVIYERGPRDFAGLMAATVDALSRSLAAVAEGAADRGAAKLANWVVAHESLLPEVESNERDEFEQIAEEFVRRQRELEAQVPEPIWASAMLDGNGVDEHVHLRGSHKRVAPEPTPRRFLAALDGTIDLSAPGSGRLQLAEKLVAPDNPLTSRVFVNRVWHHLFGRGIVPTVDNFGVLGEAPTHPELLDYLAAEFVADGWNVKNLIRRLVLSSAYRLSSEPVAESLSRDPANHLLHAARVRRLPAEAVRDSLLAVAGNLDATMGGPSVTAHITDFMRNFRSPKESGPLDGNRRRSVYLEVRRNSMSHFLTAFDKPAPATTIGARHVSNSPAQPLMLLNDPLVHQQAEVWATALVDGFATDEERIEDAYLTGYSREPDKQEVAKLMAYLQETANEKSTREGAIAAWKQVCLALINVKEFIYLR